MSGPRKKIKVRSRETIPIVDAVVEMVFARLKDVAKNARNPRASTAKEVIDKHPGLAVAVADLLLADLARRPAPPGKKRKATPAKRRKRAVKPR